MDDDLSPRARLLIDAAMEEDVPSPANADGSWEMVVSRLTLEAASEIGSFAAPAPAPRRSWVVMVVLTLVIAVAGGLLWLVMQPRPKLAPAAAPASATVPGPARATAGHAAHVEPRAAPAPVPEVDPAALLDEAESAEPTHALELLARHAQLAPMGPDAERRMALRVLALCDLARTNDARAEARAFLSEPRDPKWTKRVHDSCAGGTSAPP